MKNKHDTYEAFKEKALFVHAENFKWWHDIHTGKRLDRDMGELIMLTVSEIAEAMEGERKDLMDDHLPHRKMAEVEIADAYIRFLDICGHLFSVGIEGINGHESFLDEDIYLDELKNNKWTFNGDNKAAFLLEIVKDLGVFHSSYKDVWPGEVGISAMYVLQSLFAYCNAYDYDLFEAYKEKVAYNRKRKDHSIEERKKVGGKKF